MTNRESFIYLQWIGVGKVEETMLEQVKAQVEPIFGVPVRIRSMAARPRDAFNPARGQHSSVQILRWALRDVPSDARKILSITDCDLFIPVLTFVFGEAQLSGKGALVSTARLRIGLNGLPVPHSMYQARLVKECVHELGHTFGLIHCPSSSCVMSRSNTVRDVDEKTSALCRVCHDTLSSLRAKE